MAGRGLVAQNPPENEATKLLKEKIPIRGSEKFDFAFARNFLVPVNPLFQDTVPIDPTRSGTYSAGISMNLPLGSVFAFKLEPRATWNKLYFNAIGAKRYPTDSNGVYLWEKNRMFYAECAGGLKINLLRNENERIKLFLEFGGFFGYNLGNTLKRRTDLGEGVKYTEKFNSLNDVNSLRYGGYVRMGTNWVALQFQYRVSSVFEKNARYLHASRPGVEVNYPAPSAFEIGVVILL